MTYYNLKRRKKLPNRKLDKFLMQLQTLCKKHKMMMLKQDGRSYVVETFDPKVFTKIFPFIKDDTTEIITEEPETDDNTVDTDEE